MIETPTPLQFKNTLAQATSGDLNAQLDIAYYYLHGLGTTQNSEQAYYWYKLTAQRGSAHGQFMLASLYEIGDGVAQDFKQALYWYEQSLENEPDNAYSAYAIGVAHYEGHGTETNLEKATYYFQLAATNPEHIQAVYFYGVCLFNGYGIAKNEEEGLKLIRAAAADGEINAQEFLATLDKQPIDLDKVLKELDSLIGLKEVKDEVKRLKERLDLYQLRKQHNLVSNKPDLHLVFLGNLGTGKSTVARILSKILKGIGLLKSGHLVETSPGDLISSYVGGTPILVKAKVEEAIGGILFIDQVYTLVDDPDTGATFASEAIASLLNLMEVHRDNLVVIVAGYKKEMNSFLNKYPSFSSQFTNIIEFHDFNQTELSHIFQYFCQKEGYILTEAANQQLQKLTRDILSTKKEHFDNAKFMRNVFRETIMNMAVRVSQIEQKTKERLTTILPQDISNSDE